MPSRKPVSLAGLRVFVVEDEALVAINLEDMLADLGCSDVVVAMRIEQALAAVDKGLAADVALLDVNIAGKPVFPVAERLVKDGVPVVFATGYGRAGLPEEWQARPVLQKPYTMDELAEYLREAAAA